MLPGQGSQFPSMGASLYESDPQFKRALDDFFDAFGTGAHRLRQVWLHGSSQDLAHGPFAQPLLFGINYAAGVVWLDELKNADVTLIGHSVGELAAATLAGVFDLGLAGALLNERARLLEDAPRGGLIACRRTEESVREQLGVLGGSAVIAAENADNQCVVSCAEEDLSATMRHLGSRDVPCMRAAATQPFHSPLLAPAALEFEEFLTQHGHRLSPAGLRMVSAFSARTISDRDVLPAWFWTRQMAEKVLFWEALRRNCDSSPHTFVEIGPGTALSMAARRLPSVRAGRSAVVTTMTRHRRGAEQWKSIRREVAELFC
ncbi:acyltransferase domain-containing protein [Streptomyces atratus]|uniref:acyltransferase domain-containing protein n=1 Tax=Streptomyces atratus TaxID=1893 RepID=UPI002257E5C5|nr:acyltransferase domain-containing protein [Streptomyces atratus]MCX5339776.1 acyltransferase domain-containing protein [Streptomyces atratus]